MIYFVKDLILTKSNTISQYIIIYKCVQTLSYQNQHILAKFIIS